MERHPPMGSWMVASLQWPGAGFLQSVLLWLGANYMGPAIDAIRSLPLKKIAVLVLRTSFMLAWRLMWLLSALVKCVSAFATVWSASGLSSQSSTALSSMLLAVKMSTKMCTYAASEMGSLPSAANFWQRVPLMKIVSIGMADPRGLRCGPSWL
jgi:hypothetical protein